MRKILKSGAVSVSEDVYRIREAAARTRPAPGLEGSGAQLAEAVDMVDESAIAEMIMQKAMDQAQQIVGDAVERAEAERTERLQQARQEAEEIRRQAQRDGEVDGARAQVGAIRECVEQLELAVSRLEGEQAGFLVEYEQDLKWLALEIASKVLNKKIEQDDTELCELVRGAVNSAKGAAWITVQIADSMPHLLETLTGSLRVADGSQVEIHDVPAPPGTCIVETPTGIVDASLYVQLENLREYFKNV